MRRILRRAVRYGRTLGFHEPFFFKLVDVLAHTMGDGFPGAPCEASSILSEALRREEEAFNRTLDQGDLQLFEEADQELQISIALPAGTFDFVDRGMLVGRVLRDENGGITKSLPGQFAFQLYDTYGFPLDLTELMARERGFTVDVAGFEKLMEEQRARARGAQKKQVIELSQIETKRADEFPWLRPRSHRARMFRKSSR